MLLLRRIFKSGVNTIADAYKLPRDYVRPSDQGFVIDHQNLFGDVGNVGNNMREAMKTHGGKQPYQSPGIGAARAPVTGSAYEV